MKVDTCPYLLKAFELLSKKWTGAILHSLSLSPNKSAHFSQLKTSLETITPRILSTRLNELVKAGIIEKHEAETHHVYVLTEKGTHLIKALECISDWAHHYIKID